MNERMIQWLRKLLLCAALITHHASLITTSAQDVMELRQICSQAESNFQIGRTEEARDTLAHYLGAMKGTLKRDALRIMALCSVAEYDEQKAREYVKMMLELDPYYSVVTNDPPIFVSMVNELKAGKTAKVTTASSMEESLDEVPVPVTLITGEMIRSCGGRNLQEVLAAYVPSMNLIDCNDGINIAMRGIYSNMQEKILFLLNGHRLNSYLTNAAQPDFSMSLEKIKQIEVLRGPASSVYGGVALTAVVNIITKQGADVDGIRAKVEGGNHRQLRGDILFGKRYFDLDVLAWISGYSSRGEQRTVPQEQWGRSSDGDITDYVTLGGSGNRPTYDLGIQLSLKGWQFLYNTRFSQVRAPFTFATMAAAYNYEQYLTFNGLKPGFANSSQHADLSYQFSFLKSQFKIGAIYDRGDITQYQVLSESPVDDLGFAMGIRDYYMTFSECDGLSKYINGQEENYGFQLKANHNYAFGSDHKGSLVLGAEYSHFHLEDLRYLFGYQYDIKLEEAFSTWLSKGHENSADVSLQLKHQWRSLILNAGLRYDYKLRSSDMETNEWSPRLALIWLRPKWNVKLSYSKSFVDAPFLYRRGDLITVDMGGGLPEYSNELLPERIYSWQLSFAGHNWVKGLNFEVNGFYNDASDLIMTNILDHQNAGKNRTAGLELAADYRLPRITANLNLTWTHTFKSNLMGIDFEETFMPNDKYNDIDDNNNTPPIVMNSVVTWQATPHLRLHTHLLFESKQSSYYTDVMKLAHYYTLTNEIPPLFYDEEEEADYDYSDLYEEIEQIKKEVIVKKDMPARAIVNVGADYKIGKLTLGLNIHNLFNTRYDRSGMNTALVPQQGRWWTASVSYQF